MGSDLHFMAKELNERRHNLIESKLVPFVRRCLKQKVFDVEDEKLAQEILNNLDKLRIQ